MDWIGDYINFIFVTFKAVESCGLIPSGCICVALLRSYRCARTLPASILIVR